MENTQCGVGHRRDPSRQPLQWMGQGRLLGRYSIAQKGNTTTGLGVMIRRFMLVLSSHVHLIMTGHVCVLAVMLGRYFGQGFTRRGTCFQAQRKG